ncbi:MAG: phosphomannose isomerase type i [Lasallia pustulata]|uniref:Mannose-6-phosphate isomerase n=1 Tax=Lasallia pustulata TaxID=136370 RepID=A0A5M8PZJ7_9LECA|nr:MAG: phosphomannose isomerase type i [Lasallia pustulata]
MATSVMQLNCSCNNYPWGKKGNESLAARFCSQTPNTGFKIDNSKEYAEMWMGDYPELPAKVLSTGHDLHKVIEDNKEQLLGQNCIKKFGAVLPYLPKVLSIQKALPLQIHPDKALAARLHKEDPEKYTDDNHKPEIAVALGPFEVFAGWKPANDIQALFTTLEPLKRYLPEKNAHFDNETLKVVCQNILKSSDEVIKTTQEQIGKLPKEVFGNQSYILDLLPRLQGQYSIEDPGNLVALFTMNFMTLSAGDAIYIPADAPHAYLSGDIIECMARSNNVINTGFCPRADRDNIDLFINALTFGPHSADETMLPSSKSAKGQHGKTVEYAPPMSEFNMLKTNLKSGEKEVITRISGPSVFVVTSGFGNMVANGETHKLKEGYVFFVGQGTDVTYQSEMGMEVYTAYAE